MLETIFISLLISVSIYLLIAMVLVLLPVRRNPSADGLDFDALENGNLEQHPTVIGEQKYFTARDAKQLFYRSVSGSGNTVLVLLHGSGSEGRYLMGLAQGLNVELGLTVVVPDLRGHGRSSLGQMGDVSYLGQYIDDLEDLKKQLQVTYPKAKHLLGGHSSGGGLAIKYASANRSPFDAYLLLAPYLGYQAATVRPDSGGWVQVSKRRYVGLVMLNKVGISWFNQTAVLFFNRPEQWADALQADSYSYRLNESFAPQDVGHDLSLIPQAILVLVGSEDEAFYADKFAAIFSQYASHAEVRIVAGAKHLDLPASEASFDMIKHWFDNKVV